MRHISVAAGGGARRDRVLDDERRHAAARLPHRRRDGRRRRRRRADATHRVHRLPLVDAGRVVRRVLGERERRQRRSRHDRPVDLRRQPDRRRRTSARRRSSCSRARTRSCRCSRELHWQDGDRVGRRHVPGQQPVRDRVDRSRGDVDRRGRRLGRDRAHRRCEPGRVRVVRAHERHAALRVVAVGDDRRDGDRAAISRRCRTQRAPAARRRRSPAPTRRRTTSTTRRSRPTIATSRINRVRERPVAATTTPTPRCSRSRRAAARRCGSRRTTRRRAAGKRARA